MYSGGTLLSSSTTTSTPTTSSVLITRSSLSSSTTTNSHHNRNPSSNHHNTMSNLLSLQEGGGGAGNNHTSTRASPASLFNNNNNNMNGSNGISTTSGEDVSSLNSISNTNGDKKELHDLLDSNLNNNNSDNNFLDSSTSSTSEVENRVRSAADQNCWSTFVMTSWVTFAMIVVLIWSQWRQGGGQVQTHSLEYFVLCMIGGVLSGLPHFILTPFDQIKCRMQTGEFATAMDGLRHIWFDPAHRGQLAIRISALYKGWVPTLIGYSLQGATKFGLYEYLKWSLKAFVGPEFAKAHQVFLFLAASAMAEFCADILLAPWEAVKVKVQTNSALTGNAALTSHIVPRMYSVEGLNAFFKGLPPLWMRQVPYTMAKFATFEKTVEFMYFYVIGAPKSDTGRVVQLFVSLISGFIAGFFCTLVSHPADTVVSKLNQKNDARVGPWQVVQDLGCAGLWKGLLARIMFVGTLTAMQWLIYDSFKVLVGLQTTGGSSSSSSSSSIAAHGGSPLVHGAEHHVRHFQQQQHQNGN